MAAVTIQVRRDTAANWTSANPTLAAGEWGFETDTSLLKIGDGVTAWNSQPYSLVTASGTQTLTNKTLTSPTINTPTVTDLLLSAGTASVPPLQFTAGTNLTTPEAGVIEYDGTVFYGDFVASGRGTIPTESYIVLNSTNTLTSQTAAQPAFDSAVANGEITLPVGTYRFEYFFTLTSMSATSGTFGFALGGTATKTQRWLAASQKGAAALDTPTAPVFANGTAAADTALTAASTNTVGYSWISGIINITSAGTIIPQISLGVAAAAVVNVGSFFRIYPISPTNGATDIVVGNWS